MIEACATENVTCSHMREGPHVEAVRLKCGRHAQWRVDGSTFCWQHARPVLAGRDEEIAQAIADEGQRRKAAAYGNWILVNQRGLIYVLQPYGITPAPLKIGYTRDLGSLRIRRNDLQTAVWTQLEIVCLRQATFGAESDLHRRLREHWIRGEWFWPHPDVMRAVHTTGSPFEMPDDQAADSCGDPELEVC